MYVNKNRSMARAVLCFMAAALGCAVLVFQSIQLGLVKHRMAAMEDSLGGLRRAEKQDVDTKTELHTRDKRSVGGTVEERLQALERRRDETFVVVLSSCFLFTSLLQNLDTNKYIACKI